MRTGGRRALRALAVTGPVTGYALAKYIADQDGPINTVAVYRTLLRLAESGYVTGEWRLSEKQVNARVYSLTPTGWAIVRENRSA